MADLKVSTYVHQCPDCERHGEEIDVENVITSGVYFDVPPTCSESGLHLRKVT